MDFGWLDFPSSVVIPFAILQLVQCTVSHKRHNWGVKSKVFLQYTVRETSGLPSKSSLWQGMIKG
jgi:hypothetical protein